MLKKQDSYVKAEQKFTSNIQLENDVYEEIFDTFNLETEKVLKITMPAYVKLLCYLKLASPNEVSGIGRIQNHTVIDVTITKQTAESIATISSSHLKRIAEYDSLTNIEEWVFQWHTHPQHMAKPSAQDIEQVETSLTSAYKQGYYTYIINDELESSLHYNFRPRCTLVNQPLNDIFFEQEQTIYRIPLQTKVIGEFHEDILEEQLLQAAEDMEKLYFYKEYTYLKQYQAEQKDLFIHWHDIK